jgi:predicted dinucleotide-utilizing enzyme
MTRTVDVVIAGGSAAAVAEAIDAARRGLKVLVVVRSGGNLARRLRQRFRRALELSQPRVIVLTGAEVACVDGIHSIEAVVVCYIRSRRLVGFNASALLSFERDA